MEFVIVKENSQFLTSKRRFLTKKTPKSQWIPGFGAGNGT
jgi:hypothetical protein